MWTLALSKVWAIAVDIRDVARWRNWRSRTGCLGSPAAKRLADDAFPCGPDVVRCCGELGFSPTSRPRASVSATNGARARPSVRTTTRRGVHRGIYRSRRGDERGDPGQGFRAGQLAIQPFRKPFLLLLRPINRAGAGPRDRAVLPNRTATRNQSASLAGSTTALPISRGGGQGRRVAAAAWLAVAAPAWPPQTPDRLARRPLGIRSLVSASRAANSVSRQRSSTGAAGTGSTG